MERLYCGYCGSLLTDQCDCERDNAKNLAERMEQQQEDYYNNPLTHVGWAQQDLIDMHRSELYFD